MDQTNHCAQLYVVLIIWNCLEMIQEKKIAKALCHLYKAGKLTGTFKYYFRTAIPNVQILKILEELLIIL
jgi:predicted hydrocarbon binding protein